MPASVHLGFTRTRMTAVAAFVTSLATSVSAYSEDMLLPVWIDPNQHFETPGDLIFRDGSSEGHINMVKSILKQLDGLREAAKSKWLDEFFGGKMKCEERSGAGYAKHALYCPVPRAELYNAASLQFEAGQHLKTLSPSKPRLAYVNLLVHACEGFVLTGFHANCELIWEVALDLQSEGQVPEATVLYNALHASPHARPYELKGVDTMESFIEALRKDPSVPKCEEWIQKPLLGKGSVGSSKQEGVINAARADLLKKHTFEECGVIDAQQITPNKFFHNFILKSRPAIVRGLPKLPGVPDGGSNALAEWLKRFGDQVISGWSTPDGDFYATRGTGSEERTIRPAESHFKFSTLIDLLQFNTSNLGAVFYGQHMNLHREIPELAKELQYAEAASPLHALPLRRVNLWVAPMNEQIRSRFHYDTHDALLFPLQCGKEFYMFPPGDRDSLYYSNDHSPKSLQWEHKWPNATGQSGATAPKKIEWETKELPKPIPNAAQVDLLAPDSTSHPKFLEALKRMKRCEVRPGDALYVPAYWHHEVLPIRTESCRCLNIAVNYWHRPVLNIVTSAQAAADQPMEL